MNVRSLQCLLLAGILLAAASANPQNTLHSPGRKTPQDWTWCSKAVEHWDWLTSV